MNEENHPCNLNQLLLNICNLTYSSHEIEKFATICLRLAFSYLCVLEKRGKRIRETNSDGELESIAADCIADLFIRGKNNCYVYLVRYFDSLLKDSPSEEDLFISLRSLITKKVQQHLTRIYSQRDPEGYKLLRNVRLAARRNRLLAITRDVTGEYILLSPENQNSAMNSTIYRPGYHELQYAASMVFTAALNIDEMVSGLMKELSHNYSQQIEVSVSEIIILIRQFRKSVNHANNKAVESGFVTNTDQSDLIYEVKQTIDLLQNKITINYIYKNKLTLEQGIAIISAIKDLANDALIGERIKENYTYLQQHWPSLTYEEYLHSTRKIFEYFVRQFKDAVKKITKNFSG